MASRIPFNRVTAAGNELEYVAEAVRSDHISGDGPFTRRCHALLEQLLGAPRVLLTTSCTHALEMCALLLDIRPGDEVILPSFTFPSTGAAFLLRGARPVFCDIRPDTLNLDERRLPELLGERTRAIVAVHYAGVACEMQVLGEVAARHGLHLIEDNAHGLFGSWRGRPLGTLGCLATLSFHESKNLTCGEGGALVVNDPSHTERAEILREKGTDRSRFFRGEVDRYTWVDLGSSYLPSDILAAFLYGQLEARERIQAARRRAFETYRELLEGPAAALGLQLPTVPEDCRPAYHLFHVLFPDEACREQARSYMTAHGIKAVTHYEPLHLSGIGQRLGCRQGMCPVTESVARRILRLPLYPALTAAEQEDVVRTLVAAFHGQGRGTR
ncbi:MAG: dTDP-4-amino-4,6-dideoxygalactose transaminase [Lentisphaeria bacterium]|nr:dTDP-4-amino-4,6-dideoxygalactose transaminase [Lentisphaeria bacterium]